MSWEVRQGHVLDLLRAMPAESIHMVCTSPPYWGLRSYKTEPQVWGGEEEHEHEWSNNLPAPTKNARQGSTETIKNASLVFVGTKGSGQSCPCGSWKGELGLEPEPDCGKRHLVRLKRNLTPAQRAYVAQRLLGEELLDVEKHGTNDKA